MCDDVWSIMFAYDRWLFFIQLYVSRWEVQYQVGEVSSFKFELAIKGILITSVVQLLRRKQVIYEPDYS
jgi:hypothetical protein